MFQRTALAAAGIKSPVQALAILGQKLPGTVDPQIHMLPADQHIAFKVFGTHTVAAQTHGVLRRDAKLLAEIIQLPCARLFGVRGSLYIAGRRCCGLHALGRRCCGLHALGRRTRRLFRSRRNGTADAPCTRSSLYDRFCPHRYAPAKFCPPAVRRPGTAGPSDPLRPSGHRDIVCIPALRSPHFSLTFISRSTAVCVAALFCAAVPLQKTIFSSAGASSYRSATSTPSRASSS